MQYVAKTDYVQNMASDSGYVDVNAATYPQMGNETIGVHTHAMSLTNTEASMLVETNCACALVERQVPLLLWAAW